MLTRYRKLFHQSQWNKITYSTTESSSPSIWASLEREKRKKREDLSLAKPFEEIPGPKCYPLIKANWIFLPHIGYIDTTSLEKFYGELHRQYGKLVRIGDNLVFAFAPEYVRALIKWESGCPNRPGMEAMLKYRRNIPLTYPNVGLFVAQGKEWSELRHKCQEYFRKSDYVNDFMPLIEQVADDLVNYIGDVRDNQTLQVQDFIQVLFKWSLESVGYIALGRRFDCIHPMGPTVEGHAIINTVHESIRALHKMESGIQLFLNIPTTAYNQLVCAQSKFHKLLLNKMKQATVDMLHEGIRVKGNKKVVLWDTLLQTAKLDSKLAAILLLDMFFAGVETTASAMTFALYHLARNPDKQEILRQELNKTFIRFANITNGEEMIKHPYLHACFEETFRMNPVTVGTARILNHDIAIGGYRIPKGTKIAGILAVIGRNPEYFDRPMEFLPERHLGDAARIAAGIKIDPEGGSILPFGFGRRICIGQKIAEYEMYCLMIKLLQNYRIEYTGEPIETRLGVTNLPDRPIHLRFIDY